MRPNRRKLLIAAVGLIVVGAVGGLCARSFVANATAAQRFASIPQVPPRRVALVFGAGILTDGTPSAMLADRVDAAIALYRAGKVRKLLFSGDNSRVDYDEVGSMRKYAVERGVPKSDITLDYAGFDTYDSCYRARKIFGITSAVLVTQRYHLPRAVYDCTRLGIDAVGVGTPDWGTYDTPLMTSYEVRETIADVKSLWDVNVSHRSATLMGAYVGVR